MPYKDKEENRKYQREWARKNSKTNKANQISHQRRKIKLLMMQRSILVLYVIKIFNSVEVMDLITLILIKNIV